MAYSPGVAAPVREIAKNPETAYDYTSKGNLVAVISNGSAILGLGNLGSLASKPVMEGKSVLFKRFADIDSIDIEIDSKNTDSLNVNGIGVDYSYGFAGFSVPMNNNLLQINVESSVLTTDPIVPASVKNQSQTQNSFIEYDATLTYSGMRVSQ